MIVLPDDGENGILIIDPDRLALLQAAAKRGYTCSGCKSPVSAEDAYWMLAGLGFFYRHRENLKVAAEDFIDKLLGQNPKIVSSRSFAVAPTELPTDLGSPSAN